MRKFFLWFGVVMAVLVVAGGVGMFFLVRNGVAADVESKAYVSESVVAIGGNWDAGELWKRSSVRFRQVTNQEDLRALFDVAHQALGRLTEYRGARGDAIISVINGTMSVSAKYVARAMFENGDAEIQIAAVKNGAEWRIEGFRVNSSVLTKRLVGTRS